MALKSRSDSSLASCLNFWFRTGVSIREGSREWILDKPGTFHDLDGGQPVEIRSGDSLITILGLRPASTKRISGPPVAFLELFNPTAPLSASVCDFQSI